MNPKSNLGFTTRIMTEKAQLAKQNLEKFIIEIDKKLVTYWEKEIELKFGYNEKQSALVDEILTHSQEHNLRPAKRLRGSFTYYGYLLGHETVDEKIWRAAMAVECVHTALLMHDDFMDRDDVRRGQPTTHKYFEGGDPHYGNAMAVTVGDVVLCAGFQMLSECGFKSETVLKATQKMLRGIVETAYGQAYDVTLERLRDQWVEDDIISLHKAKTAIYTYENPLFIGGYLAELPEAAFPILHDYSMDGGVAFQLQDDILGVYGNPEKTGKSANSDLLQGKGTLLVLKAFAEGTPAQVKALERVWGARAAVDSDINDAKQAIIDSGSLEYSTKISREYAAKAAESAQKLNALNLNKEAIDYIEGIALYMVDRVL